MGGFDGGSSGEGQVGSLHGLIDNRGSALWNRNMSSWLLGLKVEFVHIAVKKCCFLVLSWHIVIHTSVCITDVLKREHGV